MSTTSYSVLLTKVRDDGTPIEEDRLPVGKFHSLEQFLQKFPDVWTLVPTRNAIGRIEYFLGFLNPDRPEKLMYVIKPGYHAPPKPKRKKARR